MEKGHIKRCINGAMMGLFTGDALGVPVEFLERAALIKTPVSQMVGFGTHNQPAGTWSDDTSLNLCLMDSLALVNNLDYRDIMERFMQWCQDGRYSPGGFAFDVGRTTSESLQRFSAGTPPLECGGVSENNNGNGSLMRVLPIAFHLAMRFGLHIDRSDAMEVIHNISSLTHRHKRCHIACGIYVLIAVELIRGEEKRTAVRNGFQKAMNYYSQQENYLEELSLFSRLPLDDLCSLDTDSIKSSGYVIHTLEAALWCFITTNNYKECVLKAVNLGDDTDTTGAVAGGLAGLYYGLESIPKEWLDALVEKEYLEDLCNLFGDALYQQYTGFENVLKYLPYFETSSIEVHWTKPELIEEDSDPGPEPRGQEVPIDTPANITEDQALDDPMADQVLIYEDQVLIHEDQVLILETPEYPETFEAFVQAFYNSALPVADYPAYLSGKIPEGTELAAAIADMDLDTLKALLTKYIRQERFDPGSWAISIQSKIFLQILTRLQHLTALIA